MAEIVNSLTNLFFVYLASIGISSCIRNNHPRVFLVAFASYLIIGIGSFLYHASLRYWMQLLDELSMIYTTCILFFAVFSHGRSKSGQILLLLFIVSLAAFITGYYYHIKDPLFHQNMFALLTATVVLRSIYIMEKILRPQADLKTKLGRRNAQILQAMWVMIGCGISAIALGFLIWNLDNMFCSHLRRWRREIGLPWGVLLEGHGWWHFFTGVACYINITYGLWLRYCRDGKTQDVYLVWPSIFGSVPTVERRQGKAVEAAKTQ